MARLIEPFTIRSITAVSRVTISPICLYRRKTALQMTLTLVHRFTDVLPPYDHLYRGAFGKDRDPRSRIGER